MNPWVADVVCMIVGHKFEFVTAWRTSTLSLNDSVTSEHACSRCGERFKSTTTEVEFTIEEAHETES